MEAASLEPGQIIDREYKVERLLSQGGMGAVYVVEHVATGKRRALKVMLSHLVRDPASRARFEREARIGARIESDNVVAVVDAGVDEATALPFLVMELLDGVDLDHVIETQHTIPAAGVADIVGQLCDALGRAHAIGVVHSDLKPENVFLEKPRRRGVAFTVKVMDFGIAKLLSDEVREARVTTPMGSPLWMAPEQTQRGAAITPATDVWALGLLVYRMLTGVSYWRGANAPDGKVSVGTMVLEVVVQPLDPASLRAREMGVAALLPPGFDGWFDRCVVREQEKRFANAALAWDALEPILGGARASTPAPPVAAQVATVMHVATQVAPLPVAWGGPVAPPAPQAVRWPMVQQRVYASVQGGAYEMATVLEVNKPSAMIRIRLDGGAEGWVPASQLRATF
ncbi:MAG: Protein kinase [Myxococcaceae bacterium]|nr:Protein kinase [Myxococcaceae bacterium]